MPTNIQSILNQNGTTYQFIFRGDWNPNDGAFPTSAFNGDMYKVSADGSFSGFFYKAGTFIMYVDGSWYKQADPSHYLRQDNPHNVDKNQVGLDQVRNVSSYSQAEADAAFASASQGSTADSAIQPGDNVSELVNDAGYIPDSQKGSANGVATLDATSKIPSSQLPDVALGGLDYQGTWDADTNTPSLSSATGTRGQYYRVSVAGTTTLDSINDWAIGDWAVFNGVNWEKIDNSESADIIRIGDNISQLTNDLNFIDASGAPLQTVAGRTGDVVLAATDVSETLDTNVQVAFNNTRAKLDDIELLTWMGL